jgi:DNA processing protein
LTFETIAVPLRMTSEVEAQTIVRILALSHFSGVGPRLLEVLVTRYGSIERIFDADAGSLMSIPGMTASAANRVASASSQISRADAYFHELRQRQIEMVSRFDAAYPKRLFELNDPPPLVFYCGRLPAENGKMAALAGGKNASSEGIEVTVEVARRFAEANVEVIASLNHGIDSAAHLGSKAGNGASFSVLDSGLDHIYPEENRSLAVDIVKTGGLLSEHPPEQKFDRGSFESSNRILAALAQTVVITEFYHDSVEILDLLKCCSQIGKLVFIMIDPRYGALTDKSSFETATRYGAIPMVGLAKVDDIIMTLV